ncbi:SAM-dependent methyltransferase [Micromonospora chersina]|uniref:SAM-dependent methyltransferase n=1 Tax=Micromonospora chersina TaxID=47854 RepID=UPI00340C25FF
MALRWREAMSTALYGPDGFFVSGPGPAAHFRTSVHASPVLASCLLRLLSSLDAALGHPDHLDVVDVGAGRGELLRSLSVAAGSLVTAPVPLAQRVRLVAVEKAPRPADLPAEIEWVDEIPQGVTGLVVATEWLDNVPLDVAVHTSTGWRYLLVDPVTGAESTGDPLTPEDTAWLAHWWPTLSPAQLPSASIKKFASAEAAHVDANLLINGVGDRVEIGRARDEAWEEAVSRVDRGLALAVDYGHLRDNRPVGGTLAGYRGGRQVAPVPDGSCDVTAHVAMDSVASAGERVARCAYTLVSQREALRALGADGGRPPLSLASRDPAGYVRALAAASAVAELTDPAGLGGHWWLLQPVGVTVDPLMAR